MGLFLVNLILVLAAVTFLAGNGDTSLLLTLVFAAFTFYVALFYQMNASHVCRGGALGIAWFASSINNLGLAVGSRAGGFAEGATGGLASSVVLLLVYGSFVAACLLLVRNFRSTVQARPVELPRSDDPDALRPDSLLEVLRRDCGILAEKCGLTKREAETAFMLSRGKTAQAIADEFGVSVNTVKTHTTHVYQKLGIHSHEELIAELERVDMSQ